MINRLLPPKPLPESFAHAYALSNQFYPQIDTALIFGTGAAAMDALLSNELKVNDLPRLRATDAQVATVMDRVTRLHSAFGIPVPTANKPHPDGRRTVTPDRVRTLMSDGWRDGVRRVSAHYAAATMPEVPPLPNMLEAYVIPNKAYPKAERRAFNTLLQPGRDGNFRPELVALGGLFKASADILADKPARAAASAYRTDFSGLFSPDITNQEWDATAQRIQGFRPVLRDILQEGLETALPQISDTAAYDVPVEAVTAILGAAIRLPGSLPSRPAGLAQAD